MDVGNLPAAGQHGVYFYQDLGFVTQRVQAFVRDGLAKGETVIVVATDEHRRAVRRSLSCSLGVIEPTYIDMDAAEYLSQFCIGGLLDKDRFMATVMPLLTQVQESGRPIRLYGEGVAVLWNQGFRQAAMELEQWWNELIPQYRFSTVLCGYASKDQTADDLVEILAAHTHASLGDAVKKL